ESTTPADLSGPRRRPSSASADRAAPRRGSRAGSRPPPRHRRTPPPRSRHPRRARAESECPAARASDPPRARCGSCSSRCGKKAADLEAGAVPGSELDATSVLLETLAHPGQTVTEHHDIRAPAVVSSMQRDAVWPCLQSNPEVARVCVPSGVRDDLLDTAKQDL